jgi:hypothetical protein
MIVDICRDVMPFRIRAGSITVIAANEGEAVELLRKTTDPDRELVSITDIFRDEIDPALVGRLLHAAAANAESCEQQRQRISVEPCRTYGHFAITPGRARSPAAASPYHSMSG